MIKLDYQGNGFNYIELALDVLISFAFVEVEHYQSVLWFMLYFVRKIL